MPNRSKPLWQRRSPDRLLRVAELIRRELLGLLQREVGDPRIHHVAITHVQVSADLSLAKIYISHDQYDQDNQQAQELLSVLNHAAGFLRTKLGQRLQLKVTPKLRFLSDSKNLPGQRIEQILANHK